LYSNQRCKKLPPAEVPQQLFESSHCPDAAQFIQGRAQLASTAACDNRAKRGRQDNIDSYGALPRRLRRISPLAHNRTGSRGGADHSPHPNVERAGNHLFADDWSVQSNKEAPSAPAMKKEAALLLRSAGHRCLLLSCEDAQSL
jgi:hypothetical protein